MSFDNDAEKIRLADGSLHVEDVLDYALVGSVQDAAALLAAWAEKYPNAEIIRTPDYEGGSYLTIRATVPGK
jgi:hypothetical protein